MDPQLPTTEIQVLFLHSPCNWLGSIGPDLTVGRTLEKERVGAVRKFQLAPGAAPEVYVLVRQDPHLAVYARAANWPA
jgi:hypothetical protein